MEEYLKEIKSTITESTQVLVCSSASLSVLTCLTAQMKIYPQSCLPELIYEMIFILSSRINSHDIRALADDSSDHVKLIPPPNSPPNSPLKLNSFNDCIKPNLIKPFNNEEWNDDDYKKYSIHAKEDIPYSYSTVIKYHPHKICEFFSEILQGVFSHIADTHFSHIQKLNIPTAP